MGFHGASFSWKPGMQLMPHTDSCHNCSWTPRGSHLKGGARGSCCWGWDFWSLGCSSERTGNCSSEHGIHKHCRASKGIKCCRILCWIHSATSGIRTQPQLCCITQGPHGDQNQSWFQSLNPNCGLWQKTGAQLPVLGSNRDSGVTPRLLHLKITISICKSNQRFGTFQTSGASSSSRDKGHLLKFLGLCLQHRLLSPLLHSSFQHLLDPAGWQPLNEKVLCVILFFVLNRKFWCQTWECLKFFRETELMSPHCGVVQSSWALIFRGKKIIWDMNLLLKMMFKRLLPCSSNFLIHCHESTTISTNSSL